MAQTVHVYHAENGWAVKRGASSRLFATRKAAVDSAREMMRKSAPSQMVVYGADGQIREYRTAGLPRVQDPPGNTPRSAAIKKAFGKLTLERLAVNNPHPPRA